MNLRYIMHRHKYIKDDIECHIQNYINLFWIKDNQSGSEIIKKWLNPSDISYVEKLIDIDEKERLDILEQKFGKQLYAIATIPYRFLPIIECPLKDNNVYCSKAYFLNHYLHHLNSTKSSDYENIQDVISDPDYIVETDNKSIVFVKRKDRYNVSIISFDVENSQLVFHKTFFVQQKKPYKNFARLFEVIPEDERPTLGISSIVHTL